MELNELKETWNLLNEQLKRNEVMNQKVVKKLIEKRMLNARDRLVITNVAAVLIMGIVLTAIPLAATQVTIRQGILWLAYTILPVTMLYALWSVRSLCKLDPASCTLIEMQRWVIRYKRQLRTELWCTPFLISGIFITVFLVHHHYRSILMIIFDGLMLLVTAVISYLGYIYADKRSVEEIEKGIEELHEFEHP